MALPPQRLVKGDVQNDTPSDNHPLGAALGQVANTYIVAENVSGGLVVVDQHAAHERLVYEQLKRAWNEGTVPSQPLLIPAPVTLTPAAVSALLAQNETLTQLGLVLEQAAPTRVMVMALPAVIAHANPTQLVQDLAEDLLVLNPNSTLQARMERVFSTFACHHSIRAHRRLSIAEQNALLRQMEAEPASLTCNHGRPTAITLTLADLEKLFARR
jgi:DNA mismatch repair protein MutL